MRTLPPICTRGAAECRASGSVQIGTIWGVRRACVLSFGGGRGQPAVSRAG